MSLISVVVPCYNEQESLPFFLSALTDVACALQAEHDAHIETILVDDGSRDGTLALMKSASAPQTAEVYAPLTIRWITFSRNFGKEAGILAELEHARGDYVAVMDADMQDPPNLLPQVYNILLTEDYDNVAARRVNRDGEPPIRSFFRPDVL